MKLVPYSIQQQFTESAAIVADFQDIGWLISVSNNEEEYRSVYFYKTRATYTQSITGIPSSLRIEIDQQLTIATTSSIGTCDDEIKHPLLSDDENKEQPAAKLKINISKPFSDMIPYAQSIFTDDQLAEMYPFLSEYGI